jgi:hypothetical protein
MSGASKVYYYKSQKMMPMLLVGCRRFQTTKTQNAVRYQNFFFFEPLLFSSFSLLLLLLTATVVDPQLSVRAADAADSFSFSHSSRSFSGIALDPENLGFLERP